MLPHSHDMEPCPIQAATNPLVSTSILVELVGPETTIGTREIALASWTTVPETPIDEQRQTYLREEEVGVTRYVAWVFGPSSNSSIAKRCLHASFRTSITVSSNA